MRLRTFGVSLGIVVAAVTTGLAVQGRSQAQNQAPTIVETATATEMVINAKDRHPRVTVTMDGGITVTADRVVVTGDEFRFAGNVTMTTVK